MGDTALGGVWREEPLALPLGGAGAARGAANVFGPPFPPVPCAAKPGGPLPTPSCAMVAGKGGCKPGSSVQITL